MFNYLLIIASFVAQVIFQALLPLFQLLIIVTKVIGFGGYAICRLLDCQFGIIYSYYLGIKTDRAFIWTALIGGLAYTIYTTAVKYADKFSDSIEKIAFDLKVAKKREEMYEIQLHTMRKKLYAVDESFENFVNQTTDGFKNVRQNIRKLEKTIHQFDA